MSGCRKGECWVLPAYEEQVGSNEGYLRKVLLESGEFSLFIHKLVQCEMLSRDKKAFGRYLEAMHCACVQSVMKLAYILLFSMCIFSMLSSLGQVRKYRRISLL